MFQIDFSRINTDRLASFKAIPSLFSEHQLYPINLDIYGIKWHDLNWENIVEELCDKLADSNSSHISINTIEVLSVFLIQIPKKYDLNTIASQFWLAARKASDDTLKAGLFLITHYHQFSETYSHYTNSQKETYDTIKNSLLDQAKSNSPKWHDTILQQTLRALLTDDAKILAQTALQKYWNVLQLLQSIKLPYQQKFAEEASFHWLNQYFNQPFHQLEQHNSAIRHWLNLYHTPQTAAQQARDIFNHSFFKNTSLKALENKIEPFTEIFIWLQKHSKSPDFLSALGQEYRAILRVWLGSGNYYQLENVVKRLDDEKHRIMNRYIFWRNYQNHFVDNWLLISQQQFQKYTPQLQNELRSLINVKFMSGDAKPIVLLRTEQFYFIQSLEVDASVDLLVTEDLNYLDNLLKQNLINHCSLEDITPCLIHDHQYLWQNDMAICLKDLGINMSDPQHFHITAHRTQPFRNHLSQQETLERQERLSKWWRYTQNKYSLELLQKCAKSFFRYFPIKNHK